MLKSIITEYGLPWVVNRSLYSIKLKIMSAMPFTERLFEKPVNIKRVDIFDIDVGRIEKFLRDLPSEKKSEIIAIADKAVRGKIAAFSSIELDYGNPIDWHYNPITKVGVDMTLKWYKIPDFDPERGDVKAIWEASRFTHFLYFARAYLINKDKKYYNAFSDQLSNWIRDNSYSYGVNYKCGQEASLRMMNALMAYSVFQSCGLDVRSDEKNLKKLIGGSYKKVLSNFFYAHKCINNNHTLSEITGLIIGAWCSDDKNRLEKAYKLLEREIENQFLSDGGYVQHSFNYQRFALQIMEFILKLSTKTNIDISNRSKKLVTNSVMLMYQMQDDTGDVPNYGWNDGALIFPVTTCAYRDFRPVINAIYALLEGKRLYSSGEYDEEILWFLEKRIDEMPIAQIKRVSSEFKQSGFYTLRHKNGFLMTVIKNFKTRPAHMDQLHIDIWHNGKNILCDSGTYSYSTDMGMQMALTGAHNTIKVDHKEQMKKHGSFLIYDWTNAINIQHSQDYFKGTMISKNGYSHTRSIKKTINGYLIKDIVSADGNKCEVYFHTPCEVQVKENGFELLMDNVVIVRVVTTGDILVRKAIRSVYYMQKEAINRVSISDKIENKQCNINFEIQFY